MKTLKIYLAHSLTQAPAELLARMKILRQALKDIPGVEVLDFAWERGPKFNEQVNVYEYDMNCVREADLVVAVLDNISSGTSMEIQSRCQMSGQPLVCFFKKGIRVSKIIADCITFHRNKNASADALPDPIEYSDDQEIIEYVTRWVRARQDHLLSVPR
nr:Nucleoside 2-deoxyribosyltransferase [uncultured bacterium]